MNRLVLIAISVVLAFAVRHFLGTPQDDLRGMLAADNRVVMYSLTTCPYCRKTREWMTKSGIPFEERFLDADPRVMTEFQEILAASQVPPGGIGTPSLVVNERLLLNNPPFETIKAHLRFRSG